MICPGLPKYIVSLAIATACRRSGNATALACFLICALILARPSQGFGTVPPVPNALDHSTSDTISLRAYLREVGRMAGAEQMRGPILYEGLLASGSLRRLSREEVRERFPELPPAGVAKAMILVSDESWKDITLARPRRPLSFAESVQRLQEEGIACVVPTHAAGLAIRHTDLGGGDEWPLNRKLGSDGTEPMTSRQAWRLLSRKYGSGLEPSTSLPISNRSEPSTFHQVRTPDEEVEEIVWPGGEERADWTARDLLMVLLAHKNETARTRPLVFVYHVNPVTGPESQVERPRWIGQVFMSTYAPDPPMREESPFYRRFFVEPK
ncbi:MAG: hypothetical protein KF858_13960 [Candidatus Sumerlaeia bacterium]|nr:hypothetical protein [Candidatus Sumerlaeia bacterium]